jgi:hypothetical protein
MADFDVTLLPESDHHLGYPLEGLLPAWGINVRVDNKTIPIAFSKRQALEIARRINAHYGVGGSTTHDWDVMSKDPSQRGPGCSDW